MPNVILIVVNEGLTLTSHLEQMSMENMNKLSDLFKELADAEEKRLKVVMLEGEDY